MDRPNHTSIIVSTTVAFCAAAIALALWWQGPVAAWQGLWVIVASEGALLTDYFALAGPGGALLNAALVTLVSLLVLRRSVGELTGSNLLVLGLMSGFSLFGQNIANLWPILAGAFLYAKWRKEPFGKYVTAGLLGASLGPVVSYLWTRPAPWAVPVALAVGLLIGFVLPALAAYTARLQNGMDLYNLGFACGLLALVGMPVLFALGGEPTTKSLWSVEYTAPLALGLGTVCVLLLLWGSFFAGQKPGDAWRAFFTLCRDSGRAGCDFLKSYGGAAVLLNTACVGLLGLGYILLIGGEVNGPTLGAILTMMGFAACGKHPRNCLPIMVGVWLSTCLPATSPTAHGSQIAALFGTTLAPLSGCFGAPFGVLAGFLHGCVVLRTGAPVAGVNLYNNGFSGGLIATVLYPILTGIFGHRLKGRDVADRL